MSGKSYFVLDGFKMYVINADYDYCYAKSKRYKYNKANWLRALKCKAMNEHDFTYSEYDCTGSTQVRISIKRKGKFIFVKYHWSKDV